MDPRAREYKFAKKAGQAMAEFLVGLVGIMFILVGLMQVQLFSRGQFSLITNLRADMAEALLAGDAASGDLIYASGTDVGTDERMYTADDKILTSDTASSLLTSFLSNVGYHDTSTGGDGVETFLEEYDVGRETDRYAALNSTANLADSFDMILKTDEISVDILPFLSDLLGTSSMNLGDKVWMPKMKGLQE